MNRQLASRRVGAKTECLWRMLLLWLLIPAGIVFMLSCATPPVTDEQVPSGHPATSFPRSTSTPATTEIAPTAGVSEAPERVMSPLETEAAEGVPVYTYRILNVYPHDREAFTQGLVYADGVFYEGTGLLQQSSLRRVKLETGEVLQLYSLPSQYFGEGITIWGERIIQLTWQSRVGFVYDKDSLELLGTFRYSTEGWGITHDGTRLIMSDGTSMLHFWDPETYEEIGRVQVHDDRGPVTMLNELEYIQGEVYANVWQTDRIAIVNPQTGQVTGWIDLGELLEPEDHALPVDVLNGIAYDAEEERLFVTGKWWPKLFEIELRLLQAEN